MTKFIKSQILQKKISNDVQNQHANSTHLNVSENEDFAFANCHFESKNKGFHLIIR